VTGETLIVAALFLAVALAMVLIGVRLGMLLAPRIDRLSEPEDEVDRVDDD
jgi:hypothetical protein